MNFLRKSVLTFLLFLSLVGVQRAGDYSLKDMESFRKYFPRTDDPYLKDILSNPNLIFYSEKQYPRIHQDASNLISSYYNISADAPPNGKELYGNANREYPWAVTAGLEGVPEDSYRVFNAYLLPPNSKIEWWTERTTNLGLTYDRVRWAFPHDTTFIEFLQVKDSKGEWYTFEVRTRTKITYKDGSNDNGFWIPEVYRPFTSKEDLLKLVKSYPDLSIARSFIENFDKDISGKQIVEDKHVNKFLRFETFYHYLPDLPEDVSRFILNSKFKPIPSTTYMKKGDLTSYAPSVRSNSKSLHIIPPKYNAAYLKVSVQ